MDEVRKPRLVRGFFLLHENEKRYLISGALHECRTSLNGKGDPADFHRLLNWLKYRLMPREIVE